MDSPAQSYAEKMGFEPRSTCEGRPRTEEAPGGRFGGQWARTPLPVQPRASHYIPLGLSFPICYLGRGRSGVLDPGPSPDPSSVPSPSRPRRATRLESHRHSTPGGRPVPLPQGGLETIGPHPGEREEAGEGRGEAGARLSPSSSPLRRRGCTCTSSSSLAPTGPAPAPAPTCLRDAAEAAFVSPCPPNTGSRPRGGNSRPGFPPS